MNPFHTSPAPFRLGTKVNVQGWDMSMRECAEPAVVRRAAPSMPAGYVAVRFVSDGRSLLVHTSRLTEAA